MNTKQLREESFFSLKISLVLLLGKLSQLVFGFFCLCQYCTYIGINYKLGNLDTVVVNVLRRPCALRVVGVVIDILDCTQFPLKCFYRLQRVPPSKEAVCRVGRWRGSVFLRRGSVFRSWCSVFCRWGTVGIFGSFQQIEKERSNESKGDQGVKKEGEGIYCEVGACEENPSSLKNLLNDGIVLKSSFQDRGIHDWSEPERVLCWTKGYPHSFKQGNLATPKMWQSCFQVTLVSRKKVQIPISWSNLSKKLAQRFLLEDNITGAYCNLNQFSNKSYL